jgi:hypothetical protein
MDYETSELTNEVQELINPEWMSDEKLQGILRNEIDDAVDFIDNIVSPVRARATEYYRGEPYGDEEDGRSQVVSMDVRDTVQAIMPSLMRVFTSSDETVEFAPRSAEDVPNAMQATEYVNYIFHSDNNGFLELHSAFKDALIRKNGILKFYWDEAVETSTSEMTGLDDAALAMLSADPDVSLDVVESYPAMEQTQEMAMMGMEPPLLHDVVATHRRSNGRVKVEAVPPEEFLIDRRAKNIKSADFVGHRRVVTVSDLIAMGYDADEVEGLASDTDKMDLNVERYTRNPALTSRTADRRDSAMRKVTYIEAYIRVDRDGDGIAELRKVCVAGSGYKILMDEACDFAPFASFTPDPEPHEFFGISSADVVMDIQRIKSVIMRNTLDSLAMAIHPRIAITEGQVNLQDVMNTEVGGIIRQRSAGQVQPIAMPFVGQQAFPVLQYMDETKQSRTGISKAAAGLDADALQSSTASAVNATVNAAAQHIEMIARIFAETGMRDLFRGILRLVCKHQDQPRMVRLRNEFVPIDPRWWDATMDVSINVALGRGSDNERMMMLRQIGEMQKEAIATMGPVNPLTDMGKLYNTLTEMTKLAGFKDADRFWSDPAQFQSPPQEPKQPDINEQLIALQIQQIQADMQKKAAELQIQREKMMMEDNLSRDKMEMDLYVAAEEFKAKYGTQLRVEEIKRETALDRETFKAQSDLIKGAVSGQ